MCRPRRTQATGTHRCRSPQRSRHRGGLCNVHPAWGWCAVRRYWCVLHLPSGTGGGTAHAEVVRTKQVVHISDARTLPAYLEGSSMPVAIVDVGGALTLLVVPMLKENDLIGTIVI